MNYPFTAQKHVGPNNDGTAAPAPNITDSDPSTTDILFCRGIGGAQDDDWFILDTGQERSIGQVTLANVTFSASQQGLSVWVTDTATAEPTGPGTTQLGVSFLAGAATAFSTVTITGTALTGRYVLVLSLGASGQSMTAGGITLSPPAIPVPTLTATPTLPGNVPSMILSGN